MLKTFKSLNPYLKQYKKLFIVASIFTIIFSTLALVDPYVTGVLIDIIIEGGSVSLVIKGVLLITVVTLLRTFLRYKYFMKFELLSQKLVYKLRKEMYIKLQNLDFTFFDKTPNGKIMTNMTGDIEAIRHFFAWITHVSIFHGFIFIYALIVMFLINPFLAGILLIIIPIIGFISLKLSRSVKPTFVKIREQFSKLNSVVQENISGNRVIKAFASEPYEIEKFNIENQKFNDRNIEAAKVWEKYLPVLDAFAILFNVVVMLIGSLLIINDKMSIGELVTFNRLLWMINNPLRMLGWMINGTQNFIASYDRVDELLNQESKIKEIHKPVNKHTLEGYIKFENVSFHYGDLPVLENISFEVKPGETVALLGSTGSGKSTLTSLISRFYDVTNGQILIDNVPIQNYDISMLRSNISIAMQDIFLFSDSIEGNISYGVPQADKKRIRMAAEIAGVNEFIYQFDQQFDTVVGERGVGLSGGQKQRIALARAIIEDPSILILDDTTSAVDMETEYKILGELKNINEKRTTFIIAHRISSVKDADLILVMDNGRIVERGTHAELLDKKGYYYSVFFQQMGEFNLEKKVVL